jgi:hypothetical protein
LLPGIRKQDFAVQPFDVPALLDEASRQRLKQCGMRRPLALRTKVARGANKSGTEVLVPDAIDDNTSHQRCCFFKECRRQLLPTTALAQSPW